MNDFIYNLILTGEQGLTLFGTLRFRLTNPLAEVPDGGVPALLAENEQLGVITAVFIPIEGSVAIPLLTGFGSVPLQGAILATPAAPLTTILGSSDPSRQVFVQFNQISGDKIAGGLVWRPGDPAELVFSFLGVQLRLPF